MDGQKQWVNCSNCERGGNGNNKNKCAYGENVKRCSASVGCMTGIPIEKCKITVDKDLEILNLKENNRLLENGSKQLCEEIKLLIKDRDELKLMLGVILESHKKGYSFLNVPIVEKVKKLLE